MARKKAQSARAKEADATDAQSLGAIAGWVALAGLVAFAIVSLISFDSADPPSHIVAVHNDPIANLCGIVGAYLAYYTYYLFGFGIWALIIAVSAWLVMKVMRRRIGHAPLRVVGAALIAGSLSCYHALLLPNVGPLVGARAGLIATFGVGEMTERFNGFGTGLILFGVLAVGAIVAADQIVFALPRMLWRTLRFAGKARHLTKPAVAGVKALSARPERDAIVPPKKGGKKTPVDGPIDPDAGGIGGTDSFDPDDHTQVDDDDDYEYIYEDEDGEYEDDDEYEYVDEDDDAQQPERERLTPAQLREKIAKLPLRMGGATQQVARDEDIPRQESYESYTFPTIDLLEDPETNFSEKMEQFVRKQAQVLEEALQTFRIDGEVVGIESGPVVTLYSVQLAPGTKVAKVSAVSSDIARALRAQNIRIVPNMAGKTTVGIEVPNLHKERVRLKELMSTGEAEGMQLPMFLGKDASGDALVADLTRMPHMLIAGTTGSGKSVCINTILMSWLYTKRPDELKLILVDPKMVEMGQFAEIPHLMCPVVTEMSRATAILEWAVNKMEERYELLREATVRNVADYNMLTEEELYERFEPTNDLERARIPKKLPYIVIVVDELADLIMTHKEVEQSIVRIAQKARAIGIHLILATQRPQANVVTGLIKSNMPCRVAFKVASGMDSRIVLDQKGAELLLGQGDMLFLTPHTSEVSRAQGTLVTDQETRKVTRFLKDIAAPSFERSLIAIRPEVSLDTEDGSSQRDPMFDEAVRIMIETGRGSVSLLQRRLAIGYSRASRLVDQMALAGILGDHKGSVAREVLITIDDWEQMKAMEEAAETSGTLFDDSEEGVDDNSSAVSSQPSMTESDDDDCAEEVGEGETDDDEYEYEYVYEDEEDDEYEEEPYEYEKEDDEAPVIETGSDVSDEERVRAENQ